MSSGGRSGLAEQGGEMFGTFFFFFNCKLVGLGRFQEGS